MTQRMETRAGSSGPLGRFTHLQQALEQSTTEGVEAALRAADAAMRAYGEMDYSDEVDLGDRVRDLMGLRIADGTTDVMRMDVVRQHYGDQFWEMSAAGVCTSSMPVRTKWNRNRTMLSDDLAYRQDAPNHRPENHLRMADETSLAS